jgi:Arc/MetJ family transcription regulator
MRTTIVLDDEQIRRATEFTGITEKAALVRKALQTLIELEASRRLAMLGGTMPGLQKIPRRKVNAE